MLLAAWGRLTSDPDTAGEFARMALPPLHRDLAERHPRADPDDVFTAASDAVLALLKHPLRYDRDRLPLPAYLRMIAQRRLANRWEAEGRHRAGRIPWDAVELDAEARNEPEEGELSFDAPELAPVLAALTEAERAVLDLQRGGERATAAFAAVLGVSGLPAGQQEAEVKRVKDRIMARLRRAGGGRDG